MARTKTVGTHMPRGRCFFGMEGIRGRYSALRLIVPARVATAARVVFYAATLAALLSSQFKMVLTFQPYRRALSRIGAGT
jgi:hypothetical protein